MNTSTPEFILHIAQQLASLPTGMINRDSAEEAAEPPNFEWIHVCALHADTPTWLQTEYGLDPVVVKAMTTAETRPRILVRSDGVMVILRAMNMHAGADPEDMISLRIWLCDQRVVSARRRDTVTVEEVVEMIGDGNGPESPGDFLTTIAGHMFTRMQPVLEELEETLSSAEEQFVLDDMAEIAKVMAVVRCRTSRTTAG